MPKKAHKQVSPKSAAPPAASYSLALLANSPKKLLTTSGIVPVRPDGTVPENLKEQAEIIWESLNIILVEAEMQITDILSISTFVTESSSLNEDLKLIMAERDKAMNGHLPASTLIVVPRLANPAWKLEISLIAAA